MAVDIIEQCVADWLERECLSAEKTKKLQEKIEDWIEAHWNSSDAAP